jgi:hypothetical protein
MLLAQPITQIAPSGPVVSRLAPSVAGLLNRVCSSVVGL